MSQGVEVLTSRFAEAVRIRSEPLSGKDGEALGAGCGDESLVQGHEGKKRGCACNHERGRKLECIEGTESVTGEKTHCMIESRRRLCDLDPAHADFSESSFGDFVVGERKYPCMAAAPECAREFQRRNRRCDQVRIAAQDLANVSRPVLPDEQRDER